MLHKLNSAEGTPYYININDVMMIEIGISSWFFLRGYPQGFAIDRSEAEQLVALINGADAFDIKGKKRHIVTVEMFISKSGNESWKATTEAAVVIYFRQVNVEMLKEAGLWEQLNEMAVGEIAKADIVVYTLQDGDLHKVISIEPGGTITRAIAFYEVPTSANDVDGEPINLGDDVPIETEDSPPTDAFLAVVRSNDFVILDTETTGLGSDAEICQIAIIDHAGNVLLDTLVKPVRPIPVDATRIHGITNDMVKNAQGWLNVNERVWDLIHDKTVIIYNAEYDMRLIAQSEKACEPLALSDWHTVKSECAMLKFAEIYGDWNEYRGNYRWQKLDKAARYYDVTVQDAHTALGDCRMTLGVVKGMLANHTS